MSLPFDFDEEEQQVFLAALIPKPKGPYRPSFCTCGRFAKFLASGVRFDGYADTYWVKVLCSRCGEVTYD